MKEEPVAWMSPDGKVSQTEGKLFHIPLYTKPQQWYMVNKDGYVNPQTWQYLTDAEILEIVSGGRILGYEGGIGAYTRELFDKIEAKIKEKNV